MTERPTNWAGNVSYRAARLHEPSSLDELRRVVAAGDRVRALGTGHSFNGVADTTGDHVSLARMPGSIDLGPDMRTVTVGAGVRYGELASHLQEHGLALHNLGSLPHISVGGACATGTHGSGVSHGNLATVVVALELVAADGQVVTLDRDNDPDRFSGAVIGLGALGVVTRLTLTVEPTFQVQQLVYEDLPRATLDDHLEDILAAAYSVSLLTAWQGPDIDQVWVKHRVDSGSFVADPHWMGARLADGPRHPVPGMSPEACTQQLGVAGPWHERLPHFRLQFTPSAGEELQSEYLLPRHTALDALSALDGIRDRIAPVLQVSEIRTVAADELWLSPSYQRDSVAIHFTWVKDTAAVTPVLAEVEQQLAPFEPRPHWGKLFVMDPGSVQARYPRLPDFQQLQRDLDPHGKFRNELVDRYVG
ncbi:MAG: FAD-binding protein [Actinomycetes bacterium]